MQKNTAKTTGYRAESQGDDLIAAGKKVSKEMPKDTNKAKVECRKQMALQDALQDPVSFCEGY